VSEGEPENVKEEKCASGPGRYAPSETELREGDRGIKGFSMREGYY